MQTIFQWRNLFSCELQWKGDAECYDKVMDTYPNFPKIWWYNLVLAFKKRLKDILRYKTISNFFKCSTVRKTRSRLKDKERETSIN